MSLLPISYLSQFIFLEGIEASLDDGFWAMRVDKAREI